MARRRKATAATTTGSLPPSPSPPTTPLSLPAPPNTPMAGTSPSIVTTTTRRQPLLLRGTGADGCSGKSRGVRCAEVAGGTAAECAAICCCCPCGLVNLLVLAVVKLPAGLCRRALKKTRSKRRKGAAAGSANRRGLLEPKIGTAEDDDDLDQGMVVGAHSSGVGGGAVGVSLAVGWPADRSPSAEVSEMEKEMWARFYGAGFWRSQSQQERETRTDVIDQNYQFRNDTVTKQRTDNIYKYE